MRGKAHKHILAENIVAMSAKKSFGRWVDSQKKLCWKCQKDKSTIGGTVTAMDGFGGKLRKFICKDCIDAKAKQNEQT
jgi:hypothetical protein